MTVTELALPGVKLIETTYFDDNRGNSTEAYNDRTLKEYEIDTRFVVDYQCYNADAGTIRGIHFQNNPHPQVKLVRVVQGAVMDYIVDLRRNSSTYKKWICQEVSAVNRKQLYIPSGFGHAYVTLEPGTSVMYKFDDYYDRELVRAIRWDDPELALGWAVKSPILSQNDSGAPFLRDSDVNLTVGMNS